MPVMLNPAPPETMLWPTNLSHPGNGSTGNGTVAKVLELLWTKKNDAYSSGGRRPGASPPWVGRRG
jgi:hypothetical protein